MSKLRKWTKRSHREPSSSCLKLLTKRSIARNWLKNQSKLRKWISRNRRMANSPRLKLLAKDPSTLRKWADQNRRKYNSPRLKRLTKKDPSREIGPRNQPKLKKSIL